MSALFEMAFLNGISSSWYSSSFVYVIQRLKSMPGMNIINIPSMSKIGESNDENQAYNTGIKIANVYMIFSIFIVIIISSIVFKTGT